MVEQGAVFSTDRVYRYLLWRRWDVTRPVVAFIGLNPSCANECTDDPTLRRIIGYAQAWSMGGVLLANLFALVSTQPHALRTSADPVGNDNDFWLEQTCAAAKFTVAAWGNGGTLLDREKRVSAQINRLYCLKTTANGHPCHPLYLPKGLLPQPFPA